MISLFLHGSLLIYFFFVKYNIPMRVACISSFHTVYVLTSPMYTIYYISSRQIPTNRFREKGIQGGKESSQNEKRRNQNQRPKLEPKIHNVLSNISNFPFVSSYPFHFSLFPFPCLYASHCDHVSQGPRTARAHDALPSLSVPNGYDGASSRISYLSCQSQRVF